MQIVHGESNATHHVTIGNPAPILGSDGRVWMLATTSRSTFSPYISFSHFVDLMGNHRQLSSTDSVLRFCGFEVGVQMGVLYSDTDGVTWSTARELTDTLMKPNGWTTIFTGIFSHFVCMLLSEPLCHVTLTGSWHFASVHLSVSVS